MRPQDLELDALIEAALVETRTETAESPIPHLVELHRRGTRDVYERAVALSRSAIVAERVLGVRVLRELGGAPPRFATEAMPVFLSMMTSEKDAAVLRCVVSAIGYQHVEDARALDAILAHANHEDESVRFAVAATLPSLVDAERPEAIAIDALVQLAGDANADTRYYALAALTDELHLDRDERVVRALERCANDPDEQIRRATKRVLGGGSFGE